MPLIDPPEPPEGGNRLNPKDLKNVPMILRPTRYDTIPGTKPNDKGEVKPWTFVECDVWTLDRAGILDQDTDVRFSWWRAVDQLKDQIGLLVACRPVAQEDNSVILAPLTGAARDIAESVLVQIESEVAAEATPRADPGPQDEVPPEQEPPF